MNHRVLILATGFIVGICAASLLYLSGAFQPANNFRTAVKKTAPAVVNIYTSQVTDHDPATANSYISKRKLRRLKLKQELSLGSGIILDEHGHIITNHHVIQQADEITVMLFDGRKAEATLIGSDTDTDLAILKINLDDITPAKLGSSEDLQVGDPVLAIGNPYGFGQSVSAGIVSAKGRYGLNRHIYENFIQTDASINIGSSGGALTNHKGQIVGINSTIYSLSSGFSGIGLAIPVEIARKVANDIIQHGHVLRGWLGIKVQFIEHPSDKLSRNINAMITDVIADSPAEKYGLQAGDILISINKKKISHHARELMRIANMQQGDIIHIKIVREMKQKTLKVAIGSKSNEFKYNQYH